MPETCPDSHSHNKTFAVRQVNTFRARAHYHSMSPARFAHNFCTALLTTVVVAVALTGCGGEATGGSETTESLSQEEELNSSVPSPGARENGQGANASSADSSASPQSSTAEESSEAASPSAQELTGVVAPAELLNTIALPAIGNLTSIVQRGEGSEIIWALRYGLAPKQWRAACNQYKEALLEFGLTEVLSESNPLYASATFEGKSHSVSYSCEANNMVILVGPTW